jgi:pimeloyl-ACP methyl ester carboxylesterase
VPVERFNGIELFYEVSGAGEPLVLVHPSWGDHRQWAPLMDSLSGLFEVVAYDRRGHSQSARAHGQGSVYEDADDLAELIEVLGIAPAHVVATSFGATVALTAAIRRPELLATLMVHEPPLLGMLAGTELDPVLQEVRRRIGNVIELLARRDDEAGARAFIDTVARRQGAWDEELTSELREVFVRNAPTFLDESRDPDSQRLDLDGLRRFDRPALLTKGSASPPFFGAIVDMMAVGLPRFAVETIEGADHAPHETATERYADLITRFAETAMVT